MQKNKVSQRQVGDKRIQPQVSRFSGVDILNVMIEEISRGINKSPDDNRWLVGSRSPMRIGKK
ncbi:hypothetical protein KKB44_03980 [Candidatus Micrarchaeota archaeon]|nr:hypothetical protein [Candidatus Micrarchaeota archaeon]